MPLALTIERESTPPAKLDRNLKDLFREWLVDYRLRRSAEEGVNNYLIFMPDSRLDAIKDHVPVTRQDLLLIDGMPESWIDKWGENLLATIYAFLEKHDQLHNFRYAVKPTIAPSLTWQNPVEAPEPAGYGH